MKVKILQSSLVGNPEMSAARVKFLEMIVAEGRLRSRVGEFEFEFEFRISEGIPIDVALALRSA